MCVLFVWCFRVVVVFGLCVCSLFLSMFMCVIVFVFLCVVSCWSDLVILFVGMFCLCC